MNQDEILLLIIKSSLTIEKELSNTINNLFRISNAQSKKLFKPSNFSAKNKIDLLKDIGLIDDNNKYNNLILQIEIRNMFVHNEEITSFKECFDRMKIINNSDTKQKQFNKIEGDDDFKKFDNLTKINQENIKQIVINEKLRVLEILKQSISNTAFITELKLFSIELTSEISRIEQLNGLKEIKSSLRKLAMKSIIKVKKFSEYDENKLGTNVLTNGFIKNNLDSQDFEK